MHKNINLYVFLKAVLWDSWHQLDEKFVIAVKGWITQYNLAKFNIDTRNIIVLMNYSLNNYIT